MFQGANLFFQLIARQYEKTSTVFTSNKTFSQWNEVFDDVTIAFAILGRVLHHCTVINIKGESYRLKERKESMRQNRKHSFRARQNLIFSPAEKRQNFFGVFLQFQIGVDSKKGLGYAITLDKIINTAGDGALCFQPLYPVLEAGLCIVWKKYQVFSKASKSFLQQLQKE